jgi:hypothetical protein
MACLTLRSWKRKKACIVKTRMDNDSNANEGEQSPGKGNPEREKPADSHFVDADSSDAPVQVCIPESPLTKPNVLSEELLAEIRKRRKGSLHRDKTDQPFAGRVDARGLDLSGIDWHDEDFSECDLRGANLSGAIFENSNFRDADLRNTDLRDADLTAARNLIPKQLAAADLTRAKLPSNIESFEGLESVESLSQNSSKVFLSMLGAGAYTWLTLSATRDIGLLTNDYSAKLPIIGVEIPIIGFYIVMPMLLVTLFFYFHIYLQRLWEAMAQLPAIFPDGRRLDEKSYPWLMNDLVRMYVPRACW